MNVETDYEIRFPKSTGGHIEYTFHYPGNTVSSSSVDLPGTFPLESLESILITIATWRDSVYKLFTPPDMNEPDVTAQCDLEVKANTIRARPQAGNFKLDFTFDKTTKQVSATARPAFAVSWSGFLFVYAQLHTFLRVCRGDWSNELNNH